jgi:hypothetical protein
MSLKELGKSDEEIEDIVGSLIVGQNDANVTYDDANGQLIISTDVSSIRNSDDVILTDTNPGTVSDGEFLKNNGGNLIGEPVQTEPNEPDWTADSNNPTTKNLSRDVFAQFPVGLSTDIIRVFYRIENLTSFGANVELRFDGVTSGYDSVSLRGGRTVNDSRLNKLVVAGETSGAASVGIMHIQNTGNAVSVQNQVLSAGTEFFNELQTGRNLNVSPPINTIDLEANQDADATLEIYGFNL